MEKFLNDLLAKAHEVSNANYANEPVSEKIVQLDILAREIEEYKPQKRLFTAIHHVQWRQKSAMGDKQRCHVWLGEDENGEPHLHYELRTLTHTPSNYGYIDMLRQYKGMMYIEMSITLRLDAFVQFMQAIHVLNPEINEALKKFMEK